MESLISLMRCKMVMITSMMMMMIKYGKAQVHYVGGGKANWSPNINLSDWSSHQTFHSGDWLFFGFDKNQYNVLEVNKTSYEKCIESDFIKNITRGGRDVFQLTEAKTYYFICGRGYCFNGMKVAIVVSDIEPSPAPAPAPHGNRSPEVPADVITPLLLLLLLIVTSPVMYHVDFL
ncbi:Phytocyanin domain containing protein [Parasponia andersonii]|uniref:Phytocyanin domain containing protein n=1 Tax=Parasponia andersonii TaxID=3476 RepID=A0A2P5DL94_PARAD|nr:Phytocyanin domain containing protein [Parasponia andersonii]